MTMNRSKLSWPAYLAIAGAAIGIAGSLLLGGLRVANSQPPQARVEWAGNLVFTLVYLTPFALSLLALRARWAWRGSVWAGAAVLAILGAYTAFSGVSLVLLPAAALLAPAAVAAWIHARPRRLPAGALLATILVGLVAGAWLVLISGPEDGRCWELVRGPGGETTWREVPYSQSGTVTLPAESDGTGVVSGWCTNDVITIGEAGLGFFLLAAASLPVGWLVRRSPNPPEIEAGKI